jgi:hypothetical protein
MKNLDRSGIMSDVKTRFIASLMTFLTVVLISILGLNCGDQKSDETMSQGPVKLRIEQDVAASTLFVLRQGGKEPIVTQNAQQDHRPFLHPIVAPDGKGELTEYSPGHHKHQTGLYWGFTRVNGERSVSKDILKEWFYKPDKPEEIAKAIGRDYFHHYQGDYWRRESVSVVQAEGEKVQWQTVYSMLDESGAVIMTDTQNWAMQEVDGKFFLDLEWLGEAVKEITIGEFDYGGLFLRMPWRNGIIGRAVNAAGRVNQQAEGQQSEWVDVGMQVEGRDDLAHMAIFDHPSNGGFPQTWRVDDQLGIGPVRARTGDWTIEKGKTETIRHRIVAYTGDLNEIELTNLWKEYTGSLNSPDL